MTKPDYFFKTKMQCLLFCFQALLGINVNVSADEFDTLQFISSVKKTWDNNLFRRSNNESSDLITTSTAGIRLDKSYSLQRFLANISYVDTKYQENDFLDFDTVNYDLAWQWAVTPALTGTISSARSRSLSGFADFRNFTQNIRTNESSQFRAEYSPHKIWKLIAGVTNSHASNSQTFNAIPDFDFTALDYGASYNLASGAYVTFLGHKRNGSYNRTVNTIGLFDNGYSEDEYELDVIFKASGKSNLSAKLAYLSREYDNFSVRDYGAWNGFIRYELALTGKIKATTELSRMVSVFESNYSTYTETDALIANLDYYLANKLILSVNARLAERDFKQPAILGLPSRLDNERSFGGSVTWEPTRNIALTLRSTHSSRDASSTYNQFDYKDVTTAISLDLKI